MVSPEAVTVWPNMIWPTSAETLVCRSMASAMRAAAGGELAFALGAIAVELDVREVDRQAFGGVHGGERRYPRCRARRGCWRGRAAGDGTAEIVQRARQRLEDRARGHPVMRMRFVHIEVARIELERADPARIDDLDADALRGMQRPRHIVVDRVSGRRPQPSGAAGNRRCRAGRSRPCRRSACRPFPCAPGARWPAAWPARNRRYSPSPRNGSRRRTSMARRCRCRNG